MPRGPRLDYPGALHHVICRGIERRTIFRSDRDRTAFLDRLTALVQEASAGLYAWALMPNHAHALLRTGRLPLSQLAQRWLGPYATTFNLIHRRAGHLFQGRFKNVLVEDEPYVLELVRYIHLNPVRSRLPVTLDTLDTYPWTGHAVLLGKATLAAQDCAFVLRRFAPNVLQARIAYRKFVREGMLDGSSPDLEGGGLRRSSRGWEIIPRLERGRERWEFDERILGSSEFVREVLDRIQDGAAHPPLDPVSLLDSLCERVSCRLAITPIELRSPSKRQKAIDARAILSHVAVRHYGLSLSAVARHLNVGRQSIARGLARAERVLAERSSDLLEFLESRDLEETALLAERLNRPDRPCVPVPGTRLMVLRADAMIQAMVVQLRDGLVFDRAAIRFPIELRRPEGMRIEDPDTWPKVEGRVEIVGGRLLYMPPCADVQQDVVVDVAYVLRSWSESTPGFVVGGNEAGMNLGDEVRGADAGVWRRRDAEPREGKFRRLPPVLAVEVAGEDEDETALREKAHWYLDHGVEIVWLVLPETLEVAVLEQAGEQRFGKDDEIVEHAALPGLRPKVRALFAQLLA